MSLHDDLSGAIAAAMSSPHLDPRRAVVPWGEQAGRVADALGPLVVLSDPEVMARAMWRVSGTNEDIIELAATAAAGAVRAALTEISTAERRRDEDGT